MEFLDLNISNYDLKDIIKLFKISEDFDENDLKKAKQIVLKMHPDKSNLDSKYFLFYSQAYKVLYYIYNFKNTSSNKDKNKNISYNNYSNDEKNKILNNFFNENEKLKNAKDFNKWFNKEFEKNMFVNDSESNGYGDWLKSNEDIEPEKKLSQNEMTYEFERKKREVRSLIVHQNINDLYYNNVGGSNINGKAPEEYSSDMFSSLPYQDLRQAHKQSVIPVTNEDYEKIPKFNSVDEYRRHRKEIAPLSEAQSSEYLKNKFRNENLESNLRAYSLARQAEEIEKRNKSFWGGLNKLKN